MKEPLTILCTGGATGYLASFLSEAVDKFNASKDKKENVKFIPTSRMMLDIGTDPSNTKSNDIVVLRYETSQDISQAASTIYDLKPNVIVHTAALASPAKCEQEPMKAMIANCPKGLLEAIDLAQEMDDIQGNSTKITSSKWTLPMFIYISTDQVYQGDDNSSGRVFVHKNKTSEINEDKCSKEPQQKLWPPIPSYDLLTPVNEYAKSKLAFERLIIDRQSKNKPTKIEKTNYIILRASNMIGPKSPKTGQGRFLQWLDSSIHKIQGKNYEMNHVNLFLDEFRSFVYVRDVAKVILLISLSLLSETSPKLWKSVYNLGGPQNLSRYELGQLVVQHKGLLIEETNVLGIPKGKLVGASYNSPLDIGMDSTDLENEFEHFQLTPMEVAVKESLESK